MKKVAKIDLQNHQLGAVLSLPDSILCGCSDGYLCKVSNETY